METSTIADLKPGLQQTQGTASSVSESLIPRPQLGQESISDDQELFLKVLENLKNAVTKPASLVALPKKQTLSTNDINSQNVDNNIPSASTPVLSNTLSAVETKPSEPESQATRSEETEPGTTTVTVSDQTKSRILQKLASEKSAPQESTYPVYGKDVIAVPVPFTVAQAILKTPEVAGSVEISTSPLAKSTESSPAKTLYSTRSFAYLNVGKNTDKTERTNQKQGTNSVQLYPCSYCDYYSDNKSYLKQHVDIVHISDRPFKCPYCEYAGKRSHALREHLIVHTDERPFQCSVCKATFRKKGHLTNHVKLHNSKRLVKCPLCKALVYDTGENGLDAHLKNDHDTERLYGCDLCEYIAANEPDIIKHLKSVHKTQIVLHKCEKCPFETANSVDFFAHVNSHKLAENTVQIGENSPTKVLGVASFPKGSEPLSLPNTVVQLKDKDQSDSHTPKQPAAIKPVWIKCSECGFTGQDSEVIRKHMIEHLKDQGYEVVPDSREQIKEQTQAQLSEQSIPNAAETRPVSNTPSSEPQILVPVTNIDRLLPQHAGKLDFNAPILVPVTEMGMLKRLQQIPSSAFQQIATTKVQIVPTAAAASTIAKQVGSLSSGGNVSQGSKISTLPSATPVAVGGLGTSLGVPGLVTLTTAALKTDTQVSSYVQPLNSQIATSVPVHTSKTVPVTGQTVSPTHSAVLPTPRPTVSPVVGTLSSAVVASLSSQPVLSQLPLSQLTSPLPVPRHPEVAKMAHFISEENSGRQLKEVGDQASDKVAFLREGLINVQRLIHDQEKIIGKQTSQDISLPTSAQNMVVYVKQAAGQNFADKPTCNQDFTRDGTVGHYKCKLCGYTCEHQRTIKAHIWKHSGNKNIDYPMFQNGPLSVYDDEGLPLKEPTDKVVEVVSADREPVVKSSGSPVPKLYRSMSETTSSSVSMPPFIVYEKTKISNVAPALAHMITMKNLKDAQGAKNSRGDSGLARSSESEQGELSQESDSALHIDEEAELSDDGEVSYGKKRTDFTVRSTESHMTLPVNVVVETMPEEGAVDEFSGYTAMQSQQNSPRIGNRSPDTSEMSSSVVTRSTEDSSGSSVSARGQVSTFERGMLRSGKKRGQPSQNNSNTIFDEDSDGVTSAKQAKVLGEHEDSAVTLLSLLKKGPNFNPACPPKQGKVNTVVQPSVDYSNVSSPGMDESNSLEGSEPNGAKPKSGISTSLLAVIEQLRERSKSDADEENKPLPLPPKKQSKRRSRKSSQEDDTPASGIDNVEEFIIEGEVKFRCKLCHYTNESTLLLRQHMRMHKPKQEFECSLCDLIADSSEALQDHMIQHCKVRTYQCKMCNSTFNYKSQLRAHMRMHNDQDIMYCEYCDFESRNSAAMKLHSKSHLTKPPYKCDICQEEFITSFNLRIHKREGCKYERAHFKCEECDFVFFGRREMKNHLRLHMGRNTTKIVNRCPYCEHADSSIENIQKHVTEVHGESRPLKCDMCGFFAVSIRSLKSHMKRHVNDQRFVAQPLEQYKCNLCGYVCHHLPSLKSHMWRHAADEHYSYEFTNDVINAAIDFDSQTEVTETNQSHVDNFKALIFEKMKAKGLENTHETYEASAVACCWVTFRCCQCGFETINKAELNMHMSAHSDVIKMTLEISDQPSEHHGVEIEVS